MTTIQIGLWCNGNTTDSGPVIPGSNPGSPTKPSDKCRDGFLFISPDRTIPEREGKEGGGNTKQNTRLTIASGYYDLDC